MTKNVFEKIETEKLFGGPLGWFANEMVQTGWGAFPITKGRSMPTGVIESRKQKQEKAQEPAPTPEAPSARYQTPAVQYASRVPRKKLGTYLKEGVEKMKNLFKRGKKKDEIGELKQYVDRALTHEEELLYKGYTLNHTVKDKSADLNRILGRFGKTCTELNRLKRKADKDMPKLDAVKKDDSNAYTGAFHAQSKANFEANLPSMETQYKMIRDNAVGARITAEGLLRELGAMKLHLGMEGEKYQSACEIYEKESLAYESERERIETEEDKLANKLGQYLHKQSRRAGDLKVQYEALVGNFGETKKEIGVYQNRGTSLIAKLDGLREAVDSAIVDIQSYSGKK